MHLFAFRSYSKTLVDTPKLVTPQQFHVKTIVLYHAYGRLMCKNDLIYMKLLRSNQLLGVDQRLGVTPKC